VGSAAASSDNCVLEQLRRETVSLYGCFILRMHSCMRREGSGSAASSNNCVARGFHLMFHLYGCMHGWIDREARERRMLDINIGGLASVSGYAGGEAKDTLPSVLTSVPPWGGGEEGGQHTGWYLKGGAARCRLGTCPIAARSDPVFQPTSIHCVAIHPPARLTPAARWGGSTEKICALRLACF